MKKDFSKTPCIRQNRYFTLTELLVVIAIIAILAGILLPALNKARESGRSIACVSNLKQWSAAFSLYHGAYDDYYPPYNAGGITWARQLSPYIYAPDISTESGLDLVTKVAVCPSMPSQTPAGASLKLGYSLSGIWGRVFPNGTSTIGVAAASSDGSNNKKSIRTNFIVSPSEKAVMTEYFSPSTTNYISLRTNSGLNNMGLFLMHRDGSNMPFADGHVETVRFGNRLQTEFTLQTAVLPYKCYIVKDSKRATNIFLMHYRGDWR